MTSHCVFYPTPWVLGYMPMVGVTPPPSPTMIEDGDLTTSRCHCETNAGVHVHSGRDAHQNYPPGGNVAQVMQTPVHASPFLPP